MLWWRERSSEMSSKSFTLLQSVEISPPSHCSNLRSGSRRWYSCECFPSALLFGMTSVSNVCVSRTLGAKFWLARLKKLLDAAESNASLSGKGKMHPSFNLVSFGILRSPFTEKTNQWRKRADTGNEPWRGKDRMKSSIEEHWQGRGTRSILR